MINNSQFQFNLVGIYFEFMIYNFDKVYSDMAKIVDSSLFAKLCVCPNFYKSCLFFRN